MAIFYLIVTAFSASVMSVLVWAKIFELKTGKQGFLTRLSNMADPALYKMINAAERTLGLVNGENTRKVLGVTTVKLFHVFGTAGLFVSKYHSRCKEWIRGRKHIKHKGIVSFFLKNVAESKGEKKD